MATVNPSQTSTYFLTSKNNPVTFGADTDIEVNSSGSYAAVYGAAGTVWQVTNAGVLAATNPALSGTDTGAAGVDLRGGGSLNDLDTGSITGTVNGVYVAGGAGTVINAGNISGTGGVFETGGGSGGVSLRAGGSVTNYYGGAISGAVGVYLNGGSGTVTNAGDITGSGGSFSAVELLAGGSVTNQMGGVISGGDDGVSVSGSTATVTNAGAITGGSFSGSYGVWVGSGGSVTNQAGGSIVGPGGVYIGGGAGTVINAGYIKGEVSVVSLALRPKSLTNQNADSVRGAASQEALDDGIYLASGGSVSNQLGGYILASSYGVDVTGGAAKVTNAGNVRGLIRGVNVVAGGTVINQTGGAIYGGLYGVYITGGAAKITNAGEIYSDTANADDGVALKSGGSVANQAGGAISGALYGVYVTGGAATVTNAGTISGANGSVKFAGSGANKLTLQSGASLTGAAIGSTAVGATNALVLQGKGSTGVAFLNFNTLSVAAGAAWTLSGNFAFSATTVAGALTATGSLSTALTISGGSAVFKANFSGGTTFEGAGLLGVAKAYTGRISGFGLGDTIDLLGIGTATHCSLNANGELSVVGSNKSASLFFVKPTSFSGDQFVLKSDGHGGADVTLAKRPSKTITFSEYRVGTAITNQYRSDGVEFLPDKVHSKTSLCMIYSDSDDLTRPDLVNSAQGRNSYSGPIIAKFVDPNTGANGTVTQFSFDAGYFNATASTIVEWFNAKHQVIGREVNHVSGFEYFGIHSSAPIASFEVIGADIGGFGIDNLHVGHVTG